MQLLAVACLSIAAKVEETSIPQSVDLQVSHKLHCLFNIPRSIPRLIHRILIGFLTFLTLYCDVEAEG